MDNEEIKPIFDEEDSKKNAKIIVIGVGGGGSNAVNGMIYDKNEQVEYWVFNTDSQALANSPCDNKLVLGRNVTRGLGAGGNPEMGREAAEDSYNDIQLVVKGADMVFIAAGEGGGTGTGAAPIVARAAKDNGALVLAIVTRPFTFEGKGRKVHALEGISELRKYVDALIVVSNDKMMFNNGSLGMKKAFAASDEVLAQSVKTVTDLILVHGIINLDFADVKATLSNKGLSLIGIGYGEGENKAFDAASNALNSPLLETSIRGAKSMIINISVSDDTTLDDVQYAINCITDAAGGQENDVNIIFGVQFDDSFQNKMKIAIIATDFETELNLEDAPSFPQGKPISPVVKPVERDVKPAMEEKPIQRENPSKQADSVSPDYLIHFFSSKESIPHVETEKKKAIDNDPTTTFTPIVPTDSDEEEDDAIVINRKN